jgi:predicted O-methyltransferase YrrM
MSPEQGAVIYQHFRETTPDLCLELGTAHGSSAAYMAAALAENGSGHLITVDRAGAGYSPASLIDELGLADWVTFIVRGDSSYDWYLKELVQERSDDAGNCEPMFDFCYLDGAHDWTIDGLAVILIEKLLTPGGWLVLDDLEWSYARHLRSSRRRRCLRMRSGSLTCARYSTSSFASIRTSIISSSKMGIGVGLPRT